ncbi:MAG: hypothetical protein FJ404_09770 [Verrucomicrobia bacterium]|nr:hypothetical protein [Verrucomicrobiota bacterium]
MTSSPFWRRILGRACLALLAAGLQAQNASDLGSVRADRVNVRGKASLQSEVITQLSKGESVVILDEAAAAGAKQETGTPPAWLKIRMPANTPVWVNASHVDPASKSVTVRKLNIRGGVGENYSILGTVDKGAVLKEIRTVGDWMEIEAPTNTFGFVAADLITRGAAPMHPPASVPPVASAPNTKAPPPVTIQTPLPVRDLSSAPDVAKPAVPPASNSNPPSTESVKAPTPPPAPETPVAATATLSPPKPEPTNLAPAEPPVTSARPSPSNEEPPPKRVISREGIVKKARNIQAPDDYQLVSEESGRVINFLVTHKLGITLKDFVGRKLLVTGEELVDRRWPNTPIIDVEDLRIVP